MALCVGALVLALTFVLAPSWARADGDRTLRGGWSAYAPYSYTEDVKGITQWRGMDVDLLREIAREAGYTLDITEVEWVEHVRRLESGQLDFAPGATRTAAREKFALFSVPYRTVTMVLILPAGAGDSLPAETPAELVEYIRKKRFRLGIGEGTAYPSGDLGGFIDDPRNKGLLHEAREDALLPLLLDGRIDGYLSDRIVAATYIEASGAEQLVEEHPVMVDGDLHLMFSRASVAPSVVEDFSRAIRTVREGPAYRDFNARYAFPILVRLTLNSPWFFIIDIIGTIAFALSGVLLAFRHDYDIFGAFVLAALPAVGGGVVRDLITNRETLGVLSSPIYLGIITGLVLGGFVVARSARAIQKSRLGAVAVEQIERRRPHLGFAVQVCDAIGLAAFTVTGVVVAVATHASPLWIWGPILAAITAAGGGILRDVVRSEPEISVLKGELYPEIALGWGALFSVYIIWQTRQLDAQAITTGVVITVLGAFATRMATLYFRIGSPRLAA